VSGALFAILFGIAPFGLALVFLRKALDIGASMALIVATPTSKIARARDGALVEVQGAALALNDRTVHAPLSGRAVLVCRLVIAHDIGSSREILVDTTEVTPFLIDDGSGALARIEPRGARLILDPTELRGPEVLARATEYLGLRGIAGKEEEKLLCREHVITPGDPVFALGLCHHDKALPVSTGYRDRPAMQVILESAADSAMLLSNHSESQVLARLRGTRAMFVAFAVLSALAGIAFALVVIAGQDP
jgi:hypothetical protein